MSLQLMLRVEWSDAKFSQQDIISVRKVYSGIFVFASHNVLRTTGTTWPCLRLNGRVKNGVPLLEIKHCNWDCCIVQTLTLSRYVGR